MSLPSEVPSHLPSSLGPLKVTTHAEVVYDGEPCFGLTEFSKRSIQLLEGMSPATLWQTFWHEATHVIMQDSGLTKVVDPTLEEAFCNAVGTFLTAAQAQGFISVRLDTPSPAVKSEGKEVSHEAGPDH